MKHFFILALFFAFSFPSFALMPSFPSESGKSSSKTVTTTSEKSKNEVQSTAMSSAELIKKLEANKPKMNFKERLATKLITHKLKKLEKQSQKEVETTKDSQRQEGPLSILFKIVGILLIILGVVGIFTTFSTAGIGMIILGAILFLLPFLI